MSQAHVDFILSAINSDNEDDLLTLADCELPEKFITDLDDQWVFDPEGSYDPISFTEEVPSTDGSYVVLGNKCWIFGDDGKCGQFFRLSRKS